MDDCSAIDHVGYSSDRPEAPVTRQDFAVAIGNVLQKQNMHLPTTSEPTFSDEASVAGYAREAVRIMTAAGVIQGVNGKIVPNGYTTRAEAAVILYRVALRALPRTEITGVDDGAKGFLWEVKAKEGTGKLYLLGSVHFMDEGMTFSAAIADAFGASDALAVEADAVAYARDPEMQMAMLGYQMYQDGTTLEDHLSAETYDKLTQFIEGDGSELGLSMEMLASMKISLVTSTLTGLLIQQAGYGASDGVDMQFLLAAKTKGLPIIELESMEFQMELLFGSASDEYQEHALRSLLENPESVADSAEFEFIDNWKIGDVAAMEASMKASDDADKKELTGTLLQAHNEYRRRMYDDRNTKMAEKAEEFLKDGKTYFYVVGAAHMVGDTGIVKSLQRDGYTVTRIE